MKHHTHKYERRRLGSWKTKGAEIYKCTLPGCNHYLVDLETVVGRYSQCWGKVPDPRHPSKLLDCDNDVLMTRYLVFSEKRKRPMCDSCKEAKKLRRMTPEEVQRQEQQSAAIERMVAILEGKLTKPDEEDEELTEEY